MGNLYHGYDSHNQRVKVGMNMLKAHDQRSSLLSSCGHESKVWLCELYGALGLFCLSLRYILVGNSYAKIQYNPLMISAITLSGDITH